MFRSEQIKMMSFGDVGVGAQAHLQRVVAVVGEDRVRRVDALAARRGSGQCRRQVDRREGGLELRVVEEGDRDPLDSDRWAHDAVHGGLEVAARDELEHLADVDDERAGQRGHADELTVALDLQPADGVLVDEAQEPGVAVGAALTTRVQICGRHPESSTLDELIEPRGPFCQLPTTVWSSSVRR